MGDDDDGDAQAFIDVLEQFQDGLRRLRVQGRRGFVAEQDLRVAGQGTGDADALFLAARELGRIVAGPVAETDQVEEGSDFLFDDVFGSADEFQWEGNVFGNRTG